MLEIRDIMERIESVLKIRLKYEKAGWIWFGIDMAVGGALYFMTGFPWWILPSFALLWWLIRCLQIEVKGPMEYAAGLIQLVFAAWYTVMAIQVLLLERELFVKTKDFKLFLNVLVVLIVLCLLQFFIKNTAITCAAGHLILLTGAMTDYFVYSFRGNEITFADLKSAGTGLTVAANYRFTLEPRAGLVLMGTILFLTLLSRLKVVPRRKWMTRLALLLLGVGCFWYVAEQTAGTNTETWEMKGTYRNGFVLNFCLEARDSFIAAPDNYSMEAVEALEKDYPENSQDYSLSRVERPTIIAIMSESFADLSVLGELAANVKLTPFMDSMKKNTTKGYAISSVYSAKTPNSEWEFLTGNSMAFLPQGSVVYQQYISEQPTSITSHLSNLGYTCVAMHPYYETGWSRNTIYPTMGFDEMYFIDDFDNSRMLRKYISDAEFYDKIIERFERKKADEDLFIMSISMQNHGGYGEPYDNMEQYVMKQGISYTDVNQYLQLVHTTDEDTRRLIEYFSKVKEPVEIIFFGDHQPGLNSRFYQLMNGKGLSGLTLDELQNLYKVPFFIWTNYDTPEQEIELTSLNYLSTLALERANIELSPYQQFLADMMEEIPAINSQGYYSLSKGAFEYLSEAEGKEAEWINRYNILQYNNMFDEKKRSDTFFPYLQENGD